jgi:MFS family permease
MLTAFALSGGITAAVTMHQMPYLIDMGIDPLAAAGVLGLMATMSLPGRLVFAWVGDKWGERTSLILGYAFKTVGVLIWTAATNMTQILLFVIIYGVGYGGTIPVSSSLRASYFGRKAYATITGYVTLFTAITNIVYPVFAGWTYDATGSYTSAFIIIAGLQALSIVFMFFARKPKPPAKAVAI